MNRIHIWIVAVALLLLAGCRATGLDASTSEPVSGNTEPPEVSSSINTEPPKTIELHGLAELEKMRQMLTCQDESELDAYLSSVLGGGAESREDLTAFVDLMESLPIMTLIDGDITWLSHQSANGIAFVTVKSADGEWMRLEYRLSVKDIPAHIDALKTSGEIGEAEETENLQTVNGRIKVYSENKKAHSTEKGDLYTWLMSIDGILTNVVYYTEKTEPVDLSKTLNKVQITDLTDIARTQNVK